MPKCIGWLEGEDDRRFLESRAALGLESPLEAFRALFLSLSYAFSWNTSEGPCCAQRYKYFYHSFERIMAKYDKGWRDPWAHWARDMATASWLSTSGAGIVAPHWRRCCRLRRETRRKKQFLSVETSLHTWGWKNKIKNVFRRQWPIIHLVWVSMPSGGILETRKNQITCIHK